ncbi:CDP-diacylglycerol--serine O-phosphatidyltransferase [bacterium]|nr:CDP-diacylglycerol--serine O-phosphatidyltransferase [bacterium]
MNNQLRIPSLFTCVNFAGGFLSILMCLHGRFTTAVWLIIAGVLFDAFDGLIARKTGSESEFGFQLDSLADLVTSGIAPAVLVSGVYTGPPFTAAGVTLVFGLSTAYRLARYNVLGRSLDADYRGLPAPVAAVAVVSFLLFPLPDTLPRDGIWLTLVVIFSILMLSDVRYSWPRLNFSTPRERLLSVLKLTATGSMIVLPGRCIFPLFLLYALFGAGRWIVTRNKGR